MVTRDPDGNEISLEKLLEGAESLAKPIDFDGLITQGVIEKVGAWYRVLDMKKFPKHARDKIKAMKGGGLIQFRKVTKSNHDLVKKLKKQIETQKEIQRIEIATFRKKI